MNALYRLTEGNGELEALELFPFEFQVESHVEEEE